VVSMYKRGDRSVAENYRPVNLTLVVCKQMEHAIAGYLRHVWDTSGVVLDLYTHAKVS
jgi:hypothetical protein